MSDGQAAGRRDVVTQLVVKQRVPRRHDQGLVGRGQRHVQQVKNLPAGIGRSGGQRRCSQSDRGSVLIKSRRQQPVAALFHSRASGKVFRLLALEVGVDGVFRVGHGDYTKRNRRNQQQQNERHHQRYTFLSVRILYHRFLCLPAYGEMLLNRAFEVTEKTGKTLVCESEKLGMTFAVTCSSRIGVAEFTQVAAVVQLVVTWVESLK